MGEGEPPNIAINEIIDYGDNQPKLTELEANEIIENWQNHHSMQVKYAQIGFQDPDWMKVTLGQHLANQEYGRILNPNYSPNEGYKKVGGREDKFLAVLAAGGSLIEAIIEGYVDRVSGLLMHVAGNLATTFYGAEKEGKDPKKIKPDQRTIEESIDVYFDPFHDQPENILLAKERAYARAQELKEKYKIK